MLDTSTRQTRKSVTILEKKGGLGGWSRRELDYLYAFLLREYPNKKFRPKIFQPGKGSTTVAITAASWPEGELLERLIFRLGHKNFVVLIEKFVENPWISQEQPFEWEKDCA